MRSIYSAFVILSFLLLSLSNGLAHPAWGIVVDDSGIIYFADIGHFGRGCVWKLYPDGQAEVLLKDFHAHNVSLDRNGNLITAHGEDLHQLIRLNQNGSIDTLMETTDPEEFFGGNCTYSVNGHVIFGISHHLWRLNPQNRREKISEYYFGWNQSVYADSRGNVYAPDIGDSLGKIIKISPQGDASVIADNLISHTGSDYDRHQDILLGITSDNEGAVYIAELAGQRIVKIHTNGDQETYYQSDGDWFPAGLDFYDGQAFILEYKEKGEERGPRIIRWSPGHTVEVVFSYTSFQKGSFSNPGSSSVIVHFILGVLVFGLIACLIIYFRYRRSFSE